MNALLETPGASKKSRRGSPGRVGEHREPSTVCCSRCALEFHPAYTEGHCPLCGEPVAAEIVSPPLPFWASITQWVISGDRAQWTAIGLFVLVSLVMLAVTIVAYYRQ